MFTKVNNVKLIDSKLIYKVLLYFTILMDIKIFTHRSSLTILKYIKFLVLQD